jgi:hypothetical protein
MRYRPLYPALSRSTGVFHVPGAIQSYPICRTPVCRTTPRPGYADAGLCMFHERIGLEAVQELPRLHVALGAILFDRPAPKWSNTLRVFGPCDPLNVNAIGLQWEIGWMLDQWTEIVADRGGLTPRWEILDAHYPLLLGAPRCAVTFPDWTVGDMDGIEAITAFTDLHGRARTFDPEADRVEEVPGVCARCSRASLRHKTNGDTVWCDHCRTTVSWQAYDEAQSFLVAA